MIEVDSGYLLSIDPSLAATGVALFDTADHRLLGAATLSTSKSKGYSADQDLYTRLATLHDKLAKFLDKRMSDIVCVAIEDQFMQKNANTLKKLSMARAILLSDFIFRSIPIITIPPRSWQTEVLGVKPKDYGRAKQMSLSSAKKYIIATTVSEEASPISSHPAATVEDVNDIKLSSDAADAINIGRYIFMQEMIRCRS